MFLVQSIKDIKANMNTLANYLANGIEPEYSYALDRIKLGTCFIADNSSGRYKFYPSRFIGYADNNMNKHENNLEKDGRVSNPALSKILNCQPFLDSDLENEYKSYCDYLGIKVRERAPFGVKRKYWRLSCSALIIGSLTSCREC